MPLTPGSSKKVISKNIGEMMRDVKRGDGKIGNYRPPNMQKAQQVAAAVAYASARRSRRRRPKVRGYDAAQQAKQGIR